MNLRIRLYVAAGSLILAVSLLGLFLVRSVEHSEFQQIDQQLTSALPVVGAISKPSTTPLIKPPSDNHLPTGSNRISEFYVAVIYNDSRRVLLRPFSNNGSSPRIPTHTAVSGHTAQIATVGSTSGSNRWRAILISFPRQSGKLLVAASLAEVDATVNKLRLGVIFAGSGVLGVLIAAGLWVGRLGLRPIAEVTAVADAIATGDRSRRVSGTSGRTESAHLARAFNVMLDEQQALEYRLRQFVADASHELRNPVSVILGIAELWRQGQLQSGAAGDEAMRRIGQSGQQMGELVEDLLLLARLDEGTAPHRSPVDLILLVQNAVQDAWATNPSRQIICTGDTEAIVSGDPTALRQVVGNLVTNSLQHTPPVSQISIDVRRGPSVCVLTVHDQGPGMSAAEASQAFNRFWRADASRTRSGTGLGLSIVSGIVSSHGGTVDLDTATDTGTTVVVKLPVSSDQSSFSPTSNLAPYLSNTIARGSF
ncbi:MAG TPA: HAMP domain-containing sensor histidine kinase [Acidimicrobiales bacterium]